MKYKAEIIRYLTGDFPYTMELQLLGQAFAGALVVRNGINKDRHLHWFHAFALSVLMAFAGGLTNFIWMGQPTSIIANDINLASCMIAFFFVNYLPFGHRIVSTLPFTMAITSLSTLFKALGLTKFITAAFMAFKDKPSAYYSIPVLGPIFYGAMLGNMNGFLMKGVEGHLKNGMPWTFQNGLFCGTLFHFYVHDKTGPIGEILRDLVFNTGVLDGKDFKDDRTFAIAALSLFTQIVAILQMKVLLGPTFSPFNIFFILQGDSNKKYKKPPKSMQIELKSDPIDGNYEPAKPSVDNTSGPITNMKTTKKNKKKKKKQQ